MTIKGIEGMGSKAMESWRRAFCAADKKERNWKEGRSAYSLAKFILCQNGEEVIRKAVNSILADDPVMRFTDAEIECECPFDNYRNPRRQDLGMWGVTRSGQTVFVGVEAKVDESFDKTMEATLEKAKNYLADHPSSKKVERITQLCDNFEVKPEDVGELRYQLFHFAAGTASKSTNVHGGHIEIAFHIMLVLELRTECYDPKKGQENEKDFLCFMRRFFKKVPGGWELNQGRLQNKLYALLLHFPSEGFSKKS